MPRFNNSCALLFAVQGDLDSALKRFANVLVVQALDTPIAQSSAQWAHIKELSESPLSVQALEYLQVSQAAMQR